MKTKEERGKEVGWEMRVQILDDLLAASVQLTNNGEDAARMKLGCSIVTKSSGKGNRAAAILSRIFGEQ